MTPEAQNIAIATACVGTLTCCRCHAAATLIKYDAPVCSDECAESASDYTLEDGAEMIPDYINDLNAMAEAEKVLKGAAVHEYFNWLVGMIAGSCSVPRHEDYPKVVSATAAQRSEAFLKAKGLWV